MAAIAANCQCGRDFDGTVWRVRADAGGNAALLDDPGRLPAHAEGEVRKMAGFAGEKVEEIPLRHQGDELTVSGDVREVGDGESLAANGGRESCDLGVWDGQELFEEAEFVKKLEGGRVYGVSAEVTEEVFVFFEDRDLYAGASQ